MKKPTSKKSISKKSSNIKKSKGKSFLRGGAKNGALYAIGILAVAATFGGAMAGGAVPEILNLQTPPAPKDPYSCCDTGSGEACHPVLESQITYNGDTYALLKSNVYQGESGHIIPTNSFTPDGHRIFVNNSNNSARYGDRYPECPNGTDLVGISDPTNPSRRCIGIPDEMLLYVCKDTKEKCDQLINRTSVPFDAYFRVSRGEEVPYELKNFCPKPKANTSYTPQKVVGLPSPSGTANLQLETFRVEQEKVAYKWLGAWCKPADYFYPTEKTDIYFDVEPVGEFTYTDPLYPLGGWSFTASPNGDLTYQGEKYPYIYWDAAIPNKLITKPSDGFVTEYSKLNDLLGEILPKMGLNAKETSEFIDYWSNQLPDSKYYFVGVISEEQINKLAPIYVKPQPDSVLRVSLYFEALDEYKEVQEPILTGFDRKGFSVVEWGAIFDTKKHPGFSCMM